MMQDQDRQTKAERHAPSEAQIRKAQALFDKVPPASYDWNCDKGEAFLEYVEQLNQRGVPTGWVAEQVGLEPNRLYVVLNRHRARRNRATAS